MTSEKKEVLIRIRKIKEIEFSYKDLSIDPKHIEFGKNLKFALSFNYKPDLKNNTFVLKTHIIYTFENEQEPVLTFINEITFDVLGIEKVVRVKKETNEFEINNNLLIPLISVAIGTTRGMLAVKTTGKKINEFPLPILNPKEVLDQLNKKRKSK